MLKKATTQDYMQIWSFANELPSENLFIIGDIETFGLSTDFLDIWYEEIEGKLDTICLRYYDNFLIYSISAQYDVKEVILLLKQFSIVNISGLQRCIEPLFPYLEETYAIQPTQYCVLKDTAWANSSPRCMDVTMEDADELADKLAAVEEFQMDRKRCYDEIIRNLEHHIPKKVCKVNGAIVSHVGLGITSSSAAMLIGVFTCKEERGKGYAKEVLSAMIADLHKEGKQCCLFYDNPAAGRIYHSLGFVTIGTWILMKKRRLAE